MLGGNTQFYKPTRRGDQVLAAHRRGRRSASAGSSSSSRRSRNTTTLPIFEKLFLGGEYSVRGFDIRSIGPSDPQTGLVLGGNKSLLFNAEYLFSIVSQVRLIFFYDAGQVADERPAVRDGQVPHVHRRRGPVLHAGAERAVPADLCGQPAARAACSTTTSGRRRTSSSGSRWDRRSDLPLRMDDLHFVGRGLGKLAGGVVDADAQVAGRPTRLPTTMLPCVASIVGDHGLTGDAVPGAEGEPDDRDALRDRGCRCVAVTVPASVRERMRVGAVSAERRR